VDLFAGAGGFTCGAEAAGLDVVFAANHWQAAVETHERNHPGTLHSCQDLHQQDWSLVPDHDVLLASPCCQGHSKARGVDRPQHDASRSTAWAVVSAAEYHDPELVIIENVPEFLDWRLYGAWSAAMGALGYSLAPHVIDAADAGVPQNRKRVFIVCAKSAAPLYLGQPDAAHVSVRSVLDLDSGSWSKVYKPGRAASTISRHEAGRRNVGDVFLAPFYGSGSGRTGRSLDRPCGTLTTKGRWAIHRGDEMRMLTVPEQVAIQGLPEGYALPESATTATHLIGNSVSPPVVTWLLERAAAAACLPERSRIAA